MKRRAGARSDAAIACLPPRTGVRFFSLARVLEDLQLFIDCNVPLVKLVDRTFNIDRVRTKQILRYILSHNKSTCFHFEVAADILDEETIALLANAPKGMFQLEIGVQSTNADTLAAIDRKTDLRSLEKPSPRCSKTKICISILI